MFLQWKKSLVAVGSLRPLPIAAIAATEGGPTGVSGFQGLQVQGLNLPGNGAKSKGPVI